MRTLRNVLATCLLFFFVHAASAQEIGARFGDVLGNSVALDARLNNLHADISFGDGVGVELLWDVLYRPLGSTDLDWYIGAGLATLIDDPFWFGFSGEVGLEYHFAKVPVALGGDWRPTFWLIDETDFSSGGFGFNVRWVFGSRSATP